MQVGDQVKLLMMLYELEKSFGDLYTVFSEQFPEHNDLWEVLIREENGHAEAVRELYRLGYEGKSVFETGTLNQAAVQSILDYAAGIMNDARNKKYDDKKALAIAYELEKSLIEKDIFRHFKVASEFKDKLVALHTETLKHIELVK